MLSKVFNFRTALIFMFVLLLASYVVLGVVYINNIYEQATNSATSSLDVIERHEFADGSTIRVPEKVVVGEPFVYETNGKKLVENGADVRLQINCLINGYDSPYTLGTFYSDLPKGDFNLKRSAVIPVTSKLESSPKCKLRSVATYTFYRADKNGNETSFNVTETGESNTFELIVPTKPATEPADEN